MMDHYNFFSSEWLARGVKNDKLKTHCRTCDIEVTPHKAVLMKHSSSKLHKDTMKAVTNTRDIKKEILSTLSKIFAMQRLN